MKDAQELIARIVVDSLIELHKEHHRVNCNYPETDEDVIAYKDGLYFAEKVISDRFQKFVDEVTT